MYKKPEIETMVLPEDALMDKIAKPCSSEGPLVGAPERRPASGDPY